MKVNLTINTICLALYVFSSSVFAEVDLHDLEGLKSQFSNAYEQYRDSEGEEDQRRSLLRALSRGGVLKEYVQRHHAVSDRADRDLELAQQFLVLAELSLQEQKYELAEEYSAHAKLFAEEDTNEAKKITLTAMFIEIVSKRDKSYTKTLREQLSTDFGALLKLSQEYFGLNSREHFQLQERIALNIFKLPPRSDRAWLSHERSKNSLFLRYYHRIYAYQHRWGYYAEAANMLEHLYRQHLLNSSMYPFESPLEVKFFLGQYKLTRGAFGVGTELLSEVAKAQEDHTTTEYGNIATYYLFQYYQTNNQRALADLYWRNLEFLQQERTGRLIFYNRFEIPHPLYQRGENVNLSIEVSVNRQGYVKAILNEQDLPKSALKNIKRFVSDLRFMPGDGDIDRRSLELNIDMEKYRKEQFLRNEKTPQGYIFKTASHYLPGLLTQIKDSALETQSK